MAPASPVPPLRGVAQETRRGHRPDREVACLRIEAEGLSVREVEELAGGRALPASASEAPPIPRPEKVKTADVKALEAQRLLRRRTV